MVAHYDHANKTPVGIQLVMKYSLIYLTHNRSIISMAVSFHRFSCSLQPNKDRMTNVFTKPFVHIGVNNCQ